MDFLKFAHLKPEKGFGPECQWNLAPDVTSLKFRSNDCYEIWKRFISFCIPFTKDYDAKCVPFGLKFGKRFRILHETSP